MQHKKLFAISSLVVAVLTLFVMAHAQGTPPTYQLVTTIQAPGGGLCTGCTGGFDISWVDPGSQRYYLTDRTVNVGGGRVDVVDTQTNKFLYSIPTTAAEVGFRGTVPATTPGCNIGGPNGILVIPQRNQAWASDGDSTVKVIDLAARAVIAIIPTGGVCRADEMGYDPIDHIFMVANPSDDPPFVTFINTDSQTVVGKFTYPSAQSGQKGAGLEQPVYDPYTKKFYITVPAQSTNNGSVDVFDPTSFQMTASYPTTCSPAGIALTPTHHLITSCGDVLDEATGNVITTITGVSSDEIWYNVGDNLVYYGTNGGIADAATNKFVTKLPSATGHTLAVDPNTNRIFAPVTGAGIKVFAAQ